MRPAWPPTAAPQAAAGAEETSAVCGRVVLTEQEITMSRRNVIYYNAGNAQIPLGGIANLPYTDVIIGFLVPDANFKLSGQGGAWDPELANNIRTLQNAGKNVLVSFGGQNTQRYFQPTSITLKMPRILRHWSIR
jgi:hypothetical protein